MFKIEHIQRQKTGTDKQRGGMSSKNALSTVNIAP